MPLDLPPARGGLPVPVAVVSGGSRFGAAGVGWDVPLSYVHVDRSFGHRRPAMVPNAGVMPRERVSVALPGRQVEMVLEGSRWIGRSAPDLSMKSENGAWVLYDGNGLTYTFTQHPYLVGTGGPFAGSAGMWLLESIKGPGSAAVTLTYNVQLVYPPGDTVPSTSIDLQRVKYNPHPSSACFKHEIALHYTGAPIGAPAKAITVIGDRTLTRFNRLDAVEVLSRASCSDPLQRQRDYVLSYQPDPDTQQDRLASVKMYGRQGTSEANQTLPIASYRYGSASSPGLDGTNALRYQSSSPSNVWLPQGADVIGDTTRDATIFNSPIGSTNRSYLTQNNLIDLTGDGRPDLVFEKNGRLWIARNTAGPGGSTAFAAAVQLSDGTFNTPYLEARSSSVDRFDSASQTVNKEYVWRQAIDVNGDGRVDLIDAAESPWRWMIYLNTPGTGPSGITWIKRAYNITSLYKRLAGLGMAVESGYLPLSRRFTGRDHEEWVCWRWTANGYEKYSWGLPPPLGLGLSPECRNIGDPLWTDVEKSFVEWEVKDVNGDGYPDFLFNSSPVEIVSDGPPTQFISDRFLEPERFHVRLKGESGGRPNRVYAALNVQGLFILGPSATTAAHAFSAPIELVAADECGVGEWVGITEGGREYQSMGCGFLDVNGDNIADRIHGQTAYLGTGYGFGGTAKIRLPGRLKQDSMHLDVCTLRDRGTGQLPNQKETWSKAIQRTTLRDVTGDGIPDFVVWGGRYEVYVGTGAGFSGMQVPGSSTPPLKIEGSFGISVVDERCDGGESRTVKGLYDLDGDGKPEYVELGNVSAWHLKVYPLAGGSTWGTPEAGRLVEIDNGYGAVTKISYRSAKEDSSTAHQVPSPEIVVSRIETSAKLGLGGELGATEYAYGDISLFYDATIDAFRPTGYLRRVELKTTWSPGYPSFQATATIVDRYPLEPIANPMSLFYMSGAQRYGRYLRTGQVKDVTVLAGAIDTSVWSLLAVDATTDSRRIAQTSYDINTNDTRMFNITPASSGEEPCIDIMFPYDFEQSQYFGSNHYNACTVRGFLQPNAAIAWKGTSAPPADNNVQTIWDHRVVDDFGRTKSVRFRNDVFRLDDDICVDFTYASPTGQDTRVLSAVSARKAWGGANCSEGVSGTVVFAEEGWEYDLLHPGLVSQGFVTSHTVYRHATDTGAYLSTIREFDIKYDAIGNPSQITKLREDGASRVVSIEYDAFGLAAVHRAVSGTGVPTLHTFQTVDPVTSEPIGSLDENGTARSVTLDGFRRPIFEHVSGGGVDGVMTATTYFGFEGGDPQGRRVVVKEFTNPVRQSSVKTEEGQITTTFLDELGRSRFSYVALGDDYANETLVVGKRIYDPLGRVAFEADAYPASQNAATAYGTTSYFDQFGLPSVVIRGRGPQTYATAPDETIERYPTVFSHSFANYTESIATQTADALTPGSTQFGVRRESVVSAVGRTLTKSTWQNSVRLEHATFEHDRLGQLTKMTRYQNPAHIADPVASSWQLDSIGQILRLDEPSTAPQLRSYSDWGELNQVAWTPPGPEPTHSVITHYDALGRITSSLELNDGIVDWETVSKYHYDAPGQSPLINPTYVLGRLASATSASGDVVLSYDAFGRVNARMHTDSYAGVYVERHGLHVDGSRAWLELNLPDNNFGTERVDYAYDSAGQLRWMWFSDGANTEELFNATKVDPWGRLRRAWLGKKLEYTANHADVGRRLPEDVKLSSGIEARYIAFSSYDALGRELSRNEDSPTFAGTQSVAYDALGRLRSWNRTQGPSTTSAWSFVYDPLGNVTSLNDQLGAADAALSYFASDRDRTCRIGHGNGGLGGTACNVGYDSFGNVIEHPTRTGYNRIDYFNSGNVRRIVNDAGIEATFRYDPFGQVQTLDIRSPSTQVRMRTDRHFGAFVAERYRVTPTDKVYYLSRQFPGPGLTISRRGAKGPWIFQFAEMRGTRFTTDQDGRFVQDLDYAPYGETRSNGATPSSAEFSTQQWNEGEALEEFGLVHLGARLYDPVIGRFLSRDPLLIPRTAATTNPYSFAFNDPVNFSDPSGLDPNACPPGMCQLSTSFNGSDSTNLQAAVAAGLLAGSFAAATGITLPNPFSSKAQVSFYEAGFDARISSLQQGFVNQWFANDPLTRFVEGTGDFIYDSLADLYWMGTHPREALDALDYALSHPFEAGKAIIGQVWDDVERIGSGDAREMGKGAAGIASNVGPGGLKILSSFAKKIKGRLPINSKLAGTIYPASKLPKAIRGKYQHGVPFNGRGFPEFKRYSKAEVRIKLTGNYADDFAAANQKAGFARTPDGYTWHHHEDAGLMQLVPEDLHNAVRHTGGVATSGIPGYR